MANKKEILFYALLCSLVVMQIAVVNLDIWLWLKIVSALFTHAGMVCLIIFHTKQVIKNNKAVLEMQKKQAQQQVVINPTLLDMYAILKIPPQYNADGSLKDMFELLGIEPKFDKDGNRIATIYEQLGINPHFNSNGQEIPFVLRIKNRVNSIITLKAAPPPLIYITREQKISGMRPVLPVPILTEQTQVQPQFKKSQIVKVETNNKPKNKKPASVNYGKSSLKVSVTSMQKLKYASVYFVLILTAFWKYSIEVLGSPYPSR